MTKPSRPASKGRLALAGSSFRVDIARMMANAPKQSGASGASAAAGEHDVGIVPGDRAEAIADGDGARGAAHPVGGVRAGDAELDGQVAAGGAGEDGQRQRRVDRPQPPGMVLAMLLLGMGHAAEGGAHHGADPVAVLPRQVESASSSASRAAATLNCPNRSSRRARRSSR